MLIAGVAAALVVGAVVAVIALGADGEDAPAPRPAATIAPSPAGRRLRRRAGVRRAASARSSSGRGPRARRRCAGWPRGCAASSRTGASSRCPGHPGLRNVVGHLPGSKPAVAIAAHYDTKDLPGFVGANDGAGGTAAVLELARALARADRPPGAPALRFVLFDGEEATDDTRAFERDRASAARRPTRAPTPTSCAR